MKRSLVLAGVLGAGMSSIHFLPPFKTVESAMGMEIPERIGGWETQLILPSEKEVGSLAKDTRFSKAVCELPREGGGWASFGSPLRDRAELSIVLSGTDLANSIHRPERCMEAQGHVIYQSQKQPLKVGSGKSIPVSRLLSKVKVATQQGDLIELNSLTYYFFVGSETITESNYHRTFVDIRDRLQKGQAQKWSYVLISMYFRDDESDSRLNAFPTLEQADGSIQDLAGRTAEKNIDWGRVGDSPEAWSQSSTSAR